MTNYIQKAGSFLLYSVIGLAMLYSLTSNDTEHSSSRVSKEAIYSNSDGVYYSNPYRVALDNWEDLKMYLNGTETIEACSDSGCYDLEAEISDGYIVTVYFSNGGYIEPDAEIDTDGTADGYDSQDRYWEFQIDEAFIDDAVNEWVDDNRSKVERATVSEREYNP